MSGAKLKGPADEDDDEEPAEKLSVGLITLVPMLPMLLLDEETESLPLEVVMAMDELDAR
jgi:hypothetical protein